jgi:hypothetical protein
MGGLFNPDWSCTREQSHDGGGKDDFQEKGGYLYDFDGFSSRSPGSAGICGPKDGKTHRPWMRLTGHRSQGKFYPERN